VSAAWTLVRAAGEAEGGELVSCSASLSSSRVGRTQADVVEQAARMLTAIEGSAPNLSTGTMSQILEIAANSRWAFFKYGRLRTREAFAKGKYLNRKKTMDSMFTFAKVKRELATERERASPSGQVE
jgi:hypothetical protein